MSFPSAVVSPTIAQPKFCAGLPDIDDSYGDGTKDMLIE
jgi:hypothetical protein